MRKNILILFFSINCSFLFAHTYGIFTANIGNVYYGGTVAGESQFQNQAIAFLCHEYIQKYFPNIKENIYLEIGFSDDGDTGLTYDLYQGRQWQRAEHNRPVKGKGIRIIFSQNQNRTQSVLKLLEYSILNLKKLKKEESIDSSVISKILQTPTSSTIDSIMQIKVFRNLGKEAYQVNREYYFQNDKYFFVDFFNNDSVYLILNKVNQIISDYYMGSIIFETDSTGYFYNRETKKLSEQLIISNKLESFYYEHTSSDFNKKRIYFEYEAYGIERVKKKFIYLVNELFLFERVEEYEDIWVKQELDKRE